MTTAAEFSPACPADREPKASLPLLADTST